MIRRVFNRNQNEWIDVFDPTEAELAQVAQECGFPEEAVHDCLDSMHLPKYETFEGGSFLLFRYVETDSQEKADTVHALTRKVAVFLNDRYLLTVRRKDLAPIERLAKKFTSEGSKAAHVRHQVLLEIVKQVFLTFDGPLAEVEDAVESFELHIFNNLANASILESMHIVKRRARVFKRVLRQDLDALRRIEGIPAGIQKAFLNVRELGDRHYLAADEILEDVHNLLQSHISLASHRTNEIVRVLTVFSAFFLPLTFLVGVYGMNFQHMPELNWRWGYGACWIGMILVSSSIYLWFRKRGWLK